MTDDCDDETCGVKPQRVHVYWLCRNAAELSWFAALLRGAFSFSELVDVRESVLTVLQA
jgi:hypothetical protein